MSNISSDEMINAAQIFQESVEHILANTLGKSKDNLELFITKILLFEKPFLMLTHEGIVKTIDLVFSTSENRDFIFNLHFIFFSKLGNTNTDINGLIGNVARGVGLSSVHPLSAMPKEINDRVLDELDAIDLLTANKWLLIVLLIILFITINPGIAKQLTSENQ